MSPALVILLVVASIKSRAQSADQANHLGRNLTTSDSKMEEGYYYATLASATLNPHLAAAFSACILVMDVVDLRGCLISR